LAIQSSRLSAMLASASCGLRTMGCAGDDEPGSDLFRTGHGFSLQLAQYTDSHKVYYGIYLSIIRSNT
jgi:hypothetical protein